MTDINIERALREGQRQAEAGRIPAFEGVWAVAEERAARRGSGRSIAAIAVAVSIVLAVVISVMRPAEQEWEFVNPEDLASNTSWVAPSDVLLPERRFDIYEEIPVLIESTESDEGALL
jgi:hypothetical protein